MVDDSQPNQEGDRFGYLFMIAATAILLLIGSYWYMSYFLEMPTEIKPSDFRTGFTEPAPFTSQAPQGAEAVPVATFAGPGATPVAIPVAAVNPAGVNGVNREMGRSPFSAVAELIMPSVVNVSATSMPQPSQIKPENPKAPGLNFANPRAETAMESIGSGIIITAQGHILTNYHVVEGARHVFITVFGKKGNQRLVADVLRLNEPLDLAILKVEPAKPLIPAPLGGRQPIHVGDPVIAIGSPFGLDQTVSKGIISAKRKAVNIGGTMHSGLLQTDAAINRGNSGGPLSNLKGYVIGVNTAIYTTNQAFAGVGFAVSIAKAMEFIEDNVELPRIEPNLGKTAAGRPIAARPPPPIAANAALPHEDRGPCESCHEILPSANPVAFMQGPQRHMGQGAGQGQGQGQGRFNDGFAFGPGGAIGLNAAWNDGTAGGLGALLAPLDRNTAQQVQAPYPEGIFAQDVTAGSMADVAGLQAGDVIFKVDGRRPGVRGSLRAGLRRV
ncbi:MAG: trypsin-like peptidase domain-containing protein [Magnetococcales bacterium]|nr:trypsin-like peptidase domain-containing protein [Magnetococcales bacterium]